MGFSGKIEVGRHQGPRGIAAGSVPRPIPRPAPGSRQFRPGRRPVSLGTRPGIPAGFVIKPPYFDATITFETQKAGFTLELGSR